MRLVPPGDLDADFLRVPPGDLLCDADLPRPPCDLDAAAAAVLRRSVELELFLAAAAGLGAFQSLGGIIVLPAVSIHDPGPL